MANPLARLPSTHALNPRSHTCSIELPTTVGYDTDHALYAEITAASSSDIHLIGPRTAPTQHGHTIYPGVQRHHLPHLWGFLASRVLRRMAPASPDQDRMAVQQQNAKGHPAGAQLHCFGDCRHGWPFSLLVVMMASKGPNKALGSGILFTYPQIATIAGVQGLIVYALASSLPLLIFGLLGPIIRRKCPEGFVLTEWTRQRYGAVAGLFLSICTLITMFLYMVAELSALQQIVTALTGLDGLPAVIVQCVITTIYTSIGGFRVSFVTDNIQGVMVLGLIILGVIAVGVETEIDRSLIDRSGYLEPSLLGWQLIYILPVAILTNDFFLSGFWLRTFASKTDKDLWIGVSLASAGVFCILTLVGVGGLLAAWSGAWSLDDAENGYLSFFLLLGQLPAWVVGVVLVMVVSLSTAAFDSFQSAMISTGSNDLFRNKLNIWVIRGLVIVIIVPVVVVALRSPDILQIFLISDLVSAAVVPCLVLGLSEKFYWWRGFDFVIGGLGGIFSVFLFGLVYYDGDARLAGNLILLENGLYANDWSAFGAFVAAPVGGVLWGLGACALRIGALYVLARVKGRRFDALDRPLPPARAESYEDSEHDRVLEQTHDAGKSGKFFF